MKPILNGYFQSGLDAALLGVPIAGARRLMGGGEHVGKIVPEVP